MIGIKVGWKNVKEHYGICSLLAVEDGEICIGIGSNYLLIIRDYRPVWMYGNSYADNLHLQGLFTRLEDDYELLKELIDSPDVFAKNIPVYTYKDGHVLEKFCEKFGYPNLTHDGQTMWFERFVLDKEVAIIKAERELIRNIEVLGHLIVELENELLEKKNRMSELLKSPLGLKMAEHNKTS